MVHPETVGKNTIVNLIAHDTYGPHQRFAFGKKNINELQKVDEVDWEPEEYIRLIHSGFPNLSISAKKHLENYRDQFESGDSPRDYLYE